MKYLNKYLLILLLTAFFMAGCDTNELHDMNNNPNAVAQIDINYFLTALELGCAGGNPGSSTGGGADNRFLDWRTNIGFCAHVTQQLANVSGGIASGDKYFDTDMEPQNAAFIYGMTDEGKNAAEIIRQTGTGGAMEGTHANTRSAARILRALIFGRLTDLYGNIPYSEANKGLVGIYFPKYDKQKDIYTDLLKELDEAAAGFSADADPGFTSADLIYNGDVAKWKKFAFSLMLRMAMRVSNVDAALASTYVTKAIAGGVFTSNDDNVIMPMAIGPSEWLNQNGISRAMSPGDGSQALYSMLSKTMIDKLKGTDPAITADDDPRLMILSSGIGNWTNNADPTTFTPIAGGTNPLNQKGLPNGLDLPMLTALNGGVAVDVGLVYSRINVKMLQDDEPYMIMNSAEAELLQADALERGIGSGIAGTAANHYNAGVKIAMQMYTTYDASLTVSDGAVASYLAIYPYAGTKAQKLEMIGTQLWLSQFFDWYEAWSNWRRTGFPVLGAINYPGNATGGTIPRKLRLPASEVTGNPNYATGATTPDLMTTRVWWDGGAE